jgi:pimeloyl-ACP methyl ester carboxylesterase
MGFNLLPTLSEQAQRRVIPWLWRSWSPGYDPREDLGAVWAALDSPERRSAALAYYRWLVLPRRRRAANEAGFSGLLRAPRVPLLYLHGARDGCIDSRLTRLAASVLPPDRIELLPEAGHFLHLEQPFLVAERIARFIEN